MDRGIAYQAPDQSIYFSIEKYQGCGCQYGQLANLNFDEMRQGDRVSEDEYEKNASPTSPSGRRVCPRMARCTGPVRGAKVGLVGTSSAVP